MKTPDEIKKGLECCIKYLACVPASECCDVCPYIGYCSSLEKDAIDCINQLEVSNGALQILRKKLEAKVPKWISVEERLPETGKAVLVAVRNKSLAWNCVDIDFWYDRWIDNADGDWHIVTHWMPLPEPPEV